jgi:hypothetical protein
MPRVTDGAKRCPDTLTRVRWHAAVNEWGSTPAERAARYPCDGLVDCPDGVLFRAVDVEAPAEMVFRWLCQLRVAPYSYDWIDNFGRRSPRQLTPGLDDLRIGQRVMTIFELVEFHSPRDLTLRTQRSRIVGQYAVTYMVVPEGARHCRLVVKLLMALPQLAPLSSALRRLGPMADLVMMRKQLLTLKGLAERDAQAGG